VLIKSYLSEVRWP